MHTHQHHPQRLVIIFLISYQETTSHCELDMDYSYYKAVKCSNPRAPWARRTHGWASSWMTTKKQETNTPIRPHLSRRPSSRQKNYASKFHPNNTHQPSIAIEPFSWTSSATKSWRNYINNRKRKVPSKNNRNMPCFANRSYKEWRLMTGTAPWSSVWRRSYEPTKKERRLCRGKIACLRRSWSGSAKAITTIRNSSDQFIMYCHLNL